MDDKVIFSIIIPAHYSSGFITHLLSTLPDRNDLEVTIVDDSNDASEHSALKKLVDARKKSAVKVVKNKYGKGVCGARNTGLDSVQGKWIVFADSDDSFYGDILSVKMDEYASSDADQVMFRYDSKVEGTDRIGNRHVYADSIFKKYSSSNPVVTLVNTGTVYMRFIKADVVKRNKIRFNEKYKIAEDALFVTEVSLRSTVSILDDTVLYTVHDRVDSVTRKMDFALFKNWIDAQGARNRILKASVDGYEYKKVVQTRLVILIKVLTQLGARAAYLLNQYGKSIGVPLVRSDEVSFLLGKIWRKK